MTKYEVKLTEIVENEVTGITKRTELFTQIVERNPIKKIFEVINPTRIRKNA